MRGECAEWEGDLLFKEFPGNHIIEVAMKVIEIESGIAVLLSEHFGDNSVLEFSIEEGPLVTKSGHVLDTFLTLLLGRCGGGGLGQGVWHRCTGQTGYHLLFLL